MEGFLIFFLAVILIEAIWENVKLMLPNKWFMAEHTKGFPLDRIGAFVVALVVCLVAGAILDLMFVLGVFPTVTIIGLVLTAFLLSRGSNYWHDLVSRVQGAKSAVVKFSEYNLPDNDPVGSDTYVRRE